MTRRMLHVMVLVGAALLVSVAPARATTYNVSMDTNFLVGGVYSLGFSFSGVENSATVSSFALQGGGGLGAVEYSDLGMGLDLTTGFTITGTPMLPLVYFQQGFTAGTGFTYTLDLTNIPVPGPTPNGFFMYIIPVTTDDPLGADSSLAVEFNATGQVIGLYAGNGNFLGLPAPVLTQVNAPDVPEPASLLLLGTGLLGVVAYRRRRA